MDGKRQDAKPEPWWFMFEAEASDVPENIRYRKLLKYAGRVLGLRCKRVSGKGPEAEMIGKEVAPPNSA